MKLNDLTCPSCGLRCLADTAYTTCDACHRNFTAAESQGVQVPNPPGSITIQPVVVPILQFYNGTG